MKAGGEQRKKKHQKTNEKGNAGYTNPAAGGAGRVQVVGMCESGRGSVRGTAGPTVHEQPLCCNWQAFSALLLLDPKYKEKQDYTFLLNKKRCIIPNWSYMRGKICYMTLKWIRLPNQKLLW